MIQTEGEYFTYGAFIAMKKNDGQWWHVSEFTIASHSMTIHSIGTATTKEDAYQMMGKTQETDIQDNPTNQGRSNFLD